MRRLGFAFVALAIALVCAGGAAADSRIWLPLAYNQYEPVTVIVRVQWASTEMFPPEGTTLKWLLVTAHDCNGRWIGTGLTDENGEAIFTFPPRDVITLVLNEGVYAKRVSQQFTRGAEPFRATITTCGKLFDIPIGVEANWPAGLCEWQR